ARGRRRGTGRDLETSPALSQPSLAPFIRISDDLAQQRGSGHPVASLAVLEDEVEVEARESRVLARDLLGARPLPLADRLDQLPWIVLRADEALVGLSPTRV